MLFQATSVGRAAVIGLVLSSALLSSANPTYRYRNQYGEECDKNGVPIRHGGRHGGSYDDYRDVRFRDGTRDYRGDSYDSDRDVSFKDGKYDSEYDSDDDKNYDSYNSDEGSTDHDSDQDSDQESDNDVDYNYDDAPHPYDSDDDYNDDGSIVFNIDRDRDGRFHSGYKDYPYINTHRSKLPFGEIIHSCTEPDTIALTFVDGLAGYDTDDDHAGRTIEVLDYLRDNEMVASFFVTGNDRFTNNVDVLHRMIDEGHQIGHHT